MRYTRGTQEAHKEHMRWHLEHEVGGWIENGEQPRFVKMRSSLMVTPQQRTIATRIPH